MCEGRVKYECVVVSKVSELKVFPRQDNMIAVNDALKALLINCYGANNCYCVCNYF